MSSGRTRRKGKRCGRRSMISSIPRTLGSDVVSFDGSEPSETGASASAARTSALRDRGAGRVLRGTWTDAAGRAVVESGAALCAMVRTGKSNFGAGGELVLVNQSSKQRTGRGGRGAGSGLFWPHT